MEIWKKVSKKTQEFIGLKCDTCGELVKINHVEVNILIDGEANMYDFCDKQHAIAFLIDEIKKEKPEDRFIFGKGK